jgi:hypothetical protein
MTLLQATMITGSTDILVSALSQHDAMIKPGLVPKSKLLEPISIDEASSVG